MSMTSKEIVIGLWRSFATRDAGQLRDHLAEAAVWTAPADNATARLLGMPSRMHGREEIVRFIIDQLPRMFARDVRTDLKGMYADGDTVVIEMTISATLANGRAYKNEYCFIHQIADGKVVAIREFMDTYNGHRMTFGEAATI